MPASTTLMFSLRVVLNGLELAYAKHGADGLRMPSLDHWANLLRAVNKTGIDHRELPVILRLSKRAVRSRISTAVRRGWAEELKLGRGQATVRLTGRGSEAAARWKALQAAAEEYWCVQTGVDRARALRAVLEKVVAALPLEHPHYPASYGAADARITGGNGQDWRAVTRGSGDTVSNLPLSALTSQALVAFVIGYEQRSPVALSLSTDVIKRIPVEGRLLREIGDSVGVSALIRHGFLRVSGDQGSELVHLTPKGLAVSSAYDERMREVESEWCNKFGTEFIMALRRALEEVTGMAGSAMK